MAKQQQMNIWNVRFDLFAECEVFTVDWDSLQIDSTVGACLYR